MIWAGRKGKKRINKWVKEQKGERKDIKIGLGKVKIDEIWKTWNVIEREDEKKRKNKIGIDKEGEKTETSEGERGETRRIRTRKIEKFCISQEEINSNLRRGKVIRKGKRKKLGIKRKKQESWIKQTDKRK